VDLELRRFFGRLERVLSFTLPPSPRLGLESSLPIVFIVVSTCQLLDDSDLGLGVAYYRTFSAVDVLDLTTAQCVIGRVKVANRWATIDRTGELQRSWYNEDDAVEV
jgi:hypothetical protein